MAHSKMYRNFIILQEDEKKHMADGEKALSGYAKIEAKSDKCKITFYAQNLNKNNIYHIVLICYKKDIKQIVDLGPLKITDIGKGEACKEYYVNNIAGLDFSYDKISGAGICKKDNDDMKFVMYGFMNGENAGDGWKSCKMVKTDDMKAMEVKKECKKDHKDDDDHHDHHDDDDHKHHDHDDDDHHDHDHDDDHHDHDDEDHHDHHDDDDNHDHHDHDDDDHHDHHDDKECDHKDLKDKECKINCNKTRVNFDEYEEMIEKTKEEVIDPYDFKLRGSVGDFFTEIADGFEETRHKNKDLKYCKWYKVKVSCLDDMCNSTNYNKYTIAYYPMINYYPYIMKYGYFMLGYKCDSKGNLKYIVYGVPGKKDKDCQPYEGKTGFVTWMENEQGSDEGCWLMFYDYKNSTVVVPMK